jgi:hypothetical protein
VFGPPLEGSALLGQVVVAVVHFGDVARRVIEYLLDVQPGHLQLRHETRRSAAEIMRGEMLDTEMFGVLADRSGQHARGVGAFLALVCASGQDKRAAATQRLELAQEIEGKRGERDLVWLRRGSSGMTGLQQLYRDRPELVIHYFLHDVEGRAAYLSGDFVAAEHSLAQAVEQRAAAGTAATDDRRQLEALHTWLALAQVRQGHTSEAAQTIAPVVKFQRELAARNRGDRWQPKELAAALYAQALTDPANRTALLNEAARLIDNLVSEVRSTHEVQQWRARILEARRNAGIAHSG